MGTHDDEFGGRRSRVIDDSLPRQFRLRDGLALDAEADQRVSKLPLSRSLQIIDRPNRDPRNTVHKGEPHSCRSSRTSKRECANVDDVKKVGVATHVGELLLPPTPTPAMTEPKSRLRQ